MIIGSHVNYNSATQLVGATKQALEYGANTFMFYTGAPQSSRRGAINENLVQKALELMKENSIDVNNVISHAPYIINLANKEKMDSWKFSIEFLKQEIKRVNQMQVKYIVVHPGNSLTIPKQEALKNISDALNEIIDEKDQVMILLETMAGKGTECGCTIEELKTILNGVKLKEKVGFCLDTCHLHDSGIDLKKWDDYLFDFDKSIGLNKVKCIHINDSKNIMGAKKDRHANLGLGLIGFETLLLIINHPLLKKVPKILETPWVGQYPPYKHEIAMIKNNTFNANLIEEINNYYKNAENL
ncbi:MAG: deoxyribonuclease IV [Firmicutes bacterium]|nr:deoxyribonuclease IV [Bacillota bacterium]